MKAEYRDVEDAAISHVERRGTKDITHDLLTDKRRELCVLRELGGHLSRAVREFIYKHHNVAMKGLFPF